MRAQILLSTTEELADLHRAYEYRNLARGNSVKRTADIGSTGIRILKGLMERDVLGFATSCASPHLLDVSAHTVDLEYDPDEARYAD